MRKDQPGDEKEQPMRKDQPVIRNQPEMRKANFKFIYFLFLFCLTLVSCHFNPPGPGNYSAFLQGCWFQDSSYSAVDTNLYLRHISSFRFKQDSVYMKIHTIARQDYIGDSCFNKGSFTEFAKGTYLLRHDTLQITGVYTHQNYKMKVAGCYRSGYLTWLFKIGDTSSAILLMRNTQEHGIIRLVKGASMPCVNP